MTDGIDKFYTNPNVAIDCIKTVSDIYTWDWDLVVEPSAGCGAFYDQLPNTSPVVGIDIEPEHDKLIKCDFFDYTPPKLRRILIIGNPPFGRVSSLAIRFFNHAAKWADVIAFILPRTFRRVSVQNKLNLNFHLIHDHEIPIKPCCFNPPMMAKCCFQVWERQSDMRSKVEQTTVHDDWVFLQNGPKDENNQPTAPENADFALRAYGGKCGEICSKNLEILRPKSWHWIRSNIDKKTLVDRFENLDYSVSLNTARQNSIGRADLVALYSNKYIPCYDNASTI